MQRPKIFISSTIYDFKDLRSALKFWLEELGYNVQLSEFNDFEKDLDSNSFKACLKSIEKVQYFILMIGSRVGGFYDLKNKISITQQEYRMAYKIAEKQGLKLIIFVRKEIWDIKDDRKALSKYLFDNYVKEKELNKKQVAAITSHRSNFINDADFIFNFIDECCRKKEMKRAIKGRGNFPKRNWVHSFSSYKEIVDVLKNELTIDNKLSYLAHLYNVKIEIAQNLSHLFTKEEGRRLFFVSGWARFARAAVKGSIQDQSSIKGKYLRWLSIFALIGTRVGDKLSTIFIDNALMSGDFLTYNHDKNEYEASELQKAFLKLIYEISELKKIYDSKEIQYQISTFINNYKQYNGESEYKVPNLELILILAIHDHCVNIYKISKYIFDYINGKTNMNFSTLQLYPSSPLEKEAGRIKLESVKLEEILELLNR